MGRQIQLSMLPADRDALNIDTATLLSSADPQAPWTPFPAASWLPRSERRRKGNCYQDVDRTFSRNHRARTRRWHRLWPSTWGGELRRKAQPAIQTPELTEWVRQRRICTRLLARFGVGARISAQSLPVSLKKDVTGRHKTARQRAGIDPLTL